MNSAPTIHPLIQKAYAVLDGQPLDKKRLARFLKSQLEEYTVPLLYQQVDAIRRTYNGKLDRKAYRSC